MLTQEQAGLAIDMNNINSTRIIQLMLDLKGQVYQQREPVVTPPAPPSEGGELEGEARGEVARGEWLGSGVLT